MNKIFTTQEGAKIIIEKDNIDCYRGTENGTALYLEGSMEPIYIKENFVYVDSIFDL